MDLALNNLQRLICHKTQQTKPNQLRATIVATRKGRFVTFFSLPLGGNGGCR